MLDKTKEEVIKQKINAHIQEVSLLLKTINISDEKYQSLIENQARLWLLIESGDIERWNFRSNSLEEQRGLLTMKYGIALKRKPYTNGLIKEEVMQLFDLLNEEEAFPIEFESGEAECGVIGFITKEAASSLDYEYKFSGLKEFMEILLLTKDHIDPDVKDNNYQFRGIDIHVIWQ